MHIVTLFIIRYRGLMGFPNSSVGNESAGNAGDPTSIPGSGRSAGEGLDYPFQYSWASLVAQLVKNLPAMWETWVQSLGWEDLLEKGMATHSSILAWRISWTVYSMGSLRVGHDWATFSFIESLWVWRKGKPGMQQSMGLQRVGYDLAIEQQQNMEATFMSTDRLKNDIVSRWC